MKFVLVMKFSSSRPLLSDIRDVISRHLNLPGEFGVGALDGRHVLLRLESEDAMLKALSRERCNIKGFPYRIAKWDETFNPRKDACVKAVWIELPGLPFFFST